VEKGWGETVGRRSTTTSGKAPPTPKEGKTQETVDVFFPKQGKGAKSQGTIMPPSWQSVLPQVGFWRLKNTPTKGHTTALAGGYEPNSSGFFPKKKNTTLTGCMSKHILPPTIKNKNRLVQPDRKVEGEV